MQRFSQYVNNLNEARSRGEAMEEVIVAAVNGSPKDDSKFGLDKEAGVKVAKFLARNGVRGKAKVLGADTIEVSETWSRFWENKKVPASTKTPKTDFTVGNAKISLKSGDAAQLMSGGKNESVATFYAALDKTSNIEEEMATKIEGMLQDLAPSSVAATDLKTAIKNKSDDLVAKADKAHKDLMSELKTLFAENTDFRNAFAYEAMSGDVKFGGNIGACSHFLVTSFDGSSVALHSVTDSKYVSKIAKQMKVSVRFKTTSVKKAVGGKQTKTGEYRYWSVIGLIIDKMQEDVDYMLQDVSQLNENMITDFFKGVWKKIKSAFSAAIEYVKRGVKSLFDFLQVTPDIQFNNRIKF